MKTFLLLRCLWLAIELVICRAECDASSKSACSVTTAQNLGYRIQRRALAEGVQAVFDEINDPSSGTVNLSKEFHAAVFDFNNVCVAHGGNPSYVGRTLQDIMKGQGVISTPRLGELFQVAAMSGGEWVSYPWFRAHWRRSWVLGFPAKNFTLPIPSPSGLMGSDIVIPDDKNLKLTWDSPFPPPWANTSVSVDPSKAYYVEVGYMEVENNGTTCNADGGSGIFESCQHENVYNLVRHAEAELAAASEVADFQNVVQELSYENFKIHANFYVSMFAASTGKCVADGKLPSNVGKTMQEILQMSGHPSDGDLHNAMKSAALTKHGRWVTHPWTSSTSASKTRAGADVAQVVNRFSFVVGIAGRTDSDYDDPEGYYLFSGFSDPEHHMLGSSFLDEPFCKANSRTGCSVTTAQNLAFQAHDELDAAPDAADWVKRVNEDTVFPKKYNNAHHWQGFLQKPIGFYVFAYNASDALLLAQGAIPVAAPPVRPGRTTYALQRDLGVVSHPRLREVFLGIAYIVKSGWLTYQWSNSRMAGKPAPRKRTYVMPWRPPGSTGPYQVFFGVGYDDVHPEDVTKPCYASEFATCSEEHSYNLAHVVQTDIIALATSRITVEGDEVSTIEALMEKVTTSSFYKLSTGFYPFVFSYDGECMAHGMHPDSVGLTLPEMVTMRNIEGVPPDLHQQFKEAADKGGEWVKYPWKDTPEAESDLKTKYSFVLPATHNDVKYYVGVGFQSGTALPWEPTPTEPSTVTEVVTKIVTKVVTQVVTEQPSSDEDDDSKWLIPVIIIASVSVLLMGICGCVAIYFKRDRDRFKLMGSSSGDGDVIGRT